MLLLNSSKVPESMLSFLFRLFHCGIIFALLEKHQERPSHSVDQFTLTLTYCVSRVLTCVIVRGMTAL